MHKEPLELAARRAAEFIASLSERGVAPKVAVEDLRAALDKPLPVSGSDAVDVVDDLSAKCEPGLMATAGPRFFGFVIGGATPSALAADWLTSAWDQNAGLYAASPAASVVEEVAGRWLLELLGLPAHCSVAFVTGAQMSHFAALAAARHHLLAAKGWDVQEKGLNGSPRMRVLAGDQRHVTVDRALRYLGLGTSCLEPLETDSNGALHAEQLAAALKEQDVPTIVVLQAGDVNTGAFDDIDQICDLAHEAGAWVHVDGAIGLWAAASTLTRQLVPGLEKADSWTTDGHKTLNVPYDSGFMFCAHPESHNAAMGVKASYLVHSEGRERDQVDWTPEFSRRARGFATYAAINEMGSDGIAELVNRLCSHAKLFAELLENERVVVINDVTFNQVLVTFADTRNEDVTADVVREVQADGTCWLSGSTFKGRSVMRISVSNWATTKTDIELSANAILAAHRKVIS